MRFRTAGGQAAALFVLAGAVGLVNVLLPGPSNYNRPVVSVINVAAMIAGVLAWVAPWPRWSPNATLWLVPVAISLVCLSDSYGGTPSTVYGVYFVVVFAWVGMWHPPSTSVRLAAPAAVSYLLPVALSDVAPDDFVRSVGVVIPVCVILGEIMSATIDKMMPMQPTPGRQTPTTPSTRPAMASPDVLPGPAALGGCCSGSII